MRNSNPEPKKDPASAIEPANLRRVGDWRADDILFCIARRSDSQRLIIGSSDFSVFEFDASEANPERRPFKGEGHQSYVTGVTVVGQTLVSASYDRQLIWWDVDQRSQIRAVPAHEKWIRRVTASPDGRRLYSVGDDMQCRVWDAESAEPLATLCDHAPLTPHSYPSMLYAVAVSGDGRWLATGDRTGHVAIWNTESFEKAGEVETPTMYTWDPTARRHSIGGVRSLAFSPDESKLAVGGIGKIGNIDHLQGPARIEIFDWQPGKRLHEIEDETRKGLVEQILWTPDGSQLLTTGGDHKGFLTFYDAESGELIHQDGSNGHIHGIAVDEAFQTLYVAAHQRVEKWSLAPV